MLRNADELEDLNIGATDGDIGEVIDLYFDDESWAVRYLVVDTGKWLPGRKVLISPFAVQKVDLDEGRIAVNLTKQQVKDSPDIDTDKPVSRQHETFFHNYYGYPYYWGGASLWGPVAFPGAYPALIPTPPQPPDPEIRAAVQREQEQSNDTRLHSVKEVTGYHIGAADGDVGHVEDFILDDESWAIRYMIVDTVNWLPGKKVLVSPQWIEQVSWGDSKVYVGVPREMIKNSPEYDKHNLSRDYESRLHDHYGRPGYWS